MTSSPPAPLTDAEKLAALRRLDQFRDWRSLDEKRYCLVCGKIITGRQIQVAADTLGDGPQRLNCPTERCNSIPMDWALPTDEILAAIQIGEPNERNVASTTAAVSDEEPGATSQLRKLATHLKPSAPEAFQVLRVPTLVLALPNQRTPWLIKQRIA